MTLNLTAAYLETRMSPCPLVFSGSVATSSAFLKCAGGVGADGVPMPFPGTAVSLRVWDGGTLHTDTAALSFDAGDRVALFATWTGSVFNVGVVVNGNFTNLQVNGLPGNSSLIASVGLLLARS